MEIALLVRMFDGAKKMRGRDRWSRARLLEFQRRELARVRADALARSAFYRRFHAGLDARPLEDLPVLTRAVAMASFDELVTDPIVRYEAVRRHIASGAPGLFAGRFRVMLTSGTTGEPGIFAFDRRGWTRLLASYARSGEVAGCGMRLSRRRRTAAVASTHPSSMSAQLANSFASPWVPMLELDALDPLDRIVQRLNAWRPEMLVAYASSARLLAQEQLAGRLRIAPRFVFSTAEVLTPETRRLAAEAWGREPFNRYTTSETGDLAIECAEGRRLHLAEDTTIVEAVDAHGKVVGPGDWSARVLVTPLGNRLQPLIRYELSDQIRLSDEPCPCGRPFRVVDGIRGRREEQIRLPAISGTGSVDVHGFVFEFAIDDLPISGYQVVFEGEEVLRVRLANHRGTLDERWFVERLEATLREHGARPPRIVVEHVAGLARTPRGKTPLIRTEAGPDAAVQR